MASFLLRFSAINKNSEAAPRERGPADAEHPFVRHCSGSRRPGNQLATDGAGRDFSYDVLPADVISGADVIKGARPESTEGAIGGLVDLRSASPFDHKGQLGTIRVEDDRNQMSELNGQKSSAVYSNVRRRYVRCTGGCGLCRAQRPHGILQAMTVDGRVISIRTTRPGRMAMPGAALSTLTTTPCSTKTNTGSSVPRSSMSARRRVQ
jgi:hypothetical protein